MVKIQTEFQRFEEFKNEKLNNQKHKQQMIFSAEQKRADMKNAFYHMAVWNVQEAGDLINQIIQESDKKGASTVVKKVSVAEQVRQKASQMRIRER